MRVLLDTHFLIWTATDPQKITRREQALITRSELIVSAVSIFELRLKWQKFGGGHHRRPDLIDPVVALALIAGNGIELAPLTGEDCAASLDVAVPHRDPFDEMLLIHAQRLGAKLLTRDADLHGHPLAISA